MQIKTNVRAGSQNQKQKGGTSTDSTNSSEINNTVVTYYNPAAVVSRCVGL
jgi:hypothetical protein